MIVFDLPLATPFRGLERRQGVLIEGPAGWAEWSPFPEYDDAEAARWLAATLDVAQLGHPSPVRNRIPVNGIVPALPPEAASARAVASGCATIKIKVAVPGQGLAADIARVRAVREALPTAALRLDANGGWSLPEALEAAEALARFDLEYLEQPCAEVTELAELRRRLDGAVRIAADESIRRASDPFRVRDLGAADVVVLKQQPLGGARACLKLADALGLPVVVSSAVESVIGVHAGVRLAAALPELPLACGLETGRLLATDVTRPIAVEGGHITLGPDPVPDELPPASPEVAGWWRERLRRVAEYAGVALP
ncbi:MAG: o-succinylbenzoate synthase [Propionibacteriaceae bacterium]|nr:o-succinylbenzoate synthase [Propionibacteriaceae bacterium]